MDCVHAIREKIAGIFGEDGRVIIRPSGTEPKVRGMVEGRDADAVKAMAKEAADVIAAAVQQL
jgi:phosphoglucosamine mutase